MSGFAQQLADLTGLDDETIRSQIIPYLDTFPRKQALVNHLEELLGPGSAQQAFIASYSNQRFPSLPTPVAQKPSAEQNSTVPPASTSTSSTSIPKSSSTRKSKTKFPTKLPPPRKVDADSFGGIGAVYRKIHDEELHTRSGSSSRVSTPPIDSTELLAVSVPSPAPAEPKTSSTLPESVTKAASSTTGRQSVPAPTELAGGQEFTLIPTEEMKSLQDTIMVLRGESRQDVARKAKPCFCQARRHPLHPYVPLCLSCGLVLCSILSPSPMLLPSPPCPSCALPLLNTTSRAILLTTLDMKLATLTQAHEEKIRLIREERQRAWKEKRQEVELFPNLQGQPSLDRPRGSEKAREYEYFYERRRAMDIAMGKRIEDDDQRKARVLRIGSKPVKPKGVGKKKKQKGVENDKEPRASSSLSRDSSQQQKEGLAVDGGGGGEGEDVDEEEEEVGAEYDSQEEGGGDGPMADPDDDGFARHATSFPPSDLPSVPASMGWWEQVSTMPPSCYIPKSRRNRNYVDELEEKAEVIAPRQVPGAATKQESGHSNGAKAIKTGQKKSEDTSTTTITNTGD